MKLIKIILRSKMSNLRQQNLAILSIEQDITNNLNFDSIINNFSIMTVRKGNV